MRSHDHSKNVTKTSRLIVVVYCLLEWTKDVCNIGVSPNGITLSLILVISYLLEIQSCHVGSDTLFSEDISLNTQVSHVSFLWSFCANVSWTILSKYLFVSLIVSTDVVQDRLETISFVVVHTLLQNLGKIYHNREISTKCS